MNRDAQKALYLALRRDETSREPVPRLWRPAKSLAPQKPDKPLSGLRIALDPGHLGGEWRRWKSAGFKSGGSAPVQEGDLTLPRGADYWRRGYENWARKFFYSQQL